MRQIVLIIVLSLITSIGCQQRTTLAPVVEAHWRPSNTGVTQHTVVAGETLYAIAFQFDLDYRRLAAINHIASPYRVRVGQVLNVKPQPVWRPQSRPAARFYPQPRPRPAWQPQAVVRRGAWAWPVRGAVLTGFSPAQGRKGIEIVGRPGQAIHATASGTVAYAGDGLPGYGNLILIKHDHQYLSAYGYNARNLVHEGQAVRVGQPIAIIGQSPNRRYAVHFEIRKAGQPVNPSALLR